MFKSDLFRPNKFFSPDAHKNERTNERKKKRTSDVYSTRKFFEKIAELHKRIDRSTSHRGACPFPATDQFFGQIADMVFRVYVVNLEQVSILTKSTLGFWFETAKCSYESGQRICNVDDEVRDYLCLSKISSNDEYVFVREKEFVFSVVQNVGHWDT